jgi:hypothetical protein
MGRLSDLAHVVSILAAAGHIDLKLLKSDFAAAYRGCPILSEHLDLASIIIRAPDGSLHVSAQLAMPFGAVAAVYAWDRLGAALSGILQVMFNIPCSRYVDDLFWADFSSCAEETRSMAIEVISLLGFTLAIDKTPSPAPSQDVLGVTVTLIESSSGTSLELVPEPRKLEVWKLSVASALVTGSMDFQSCQQLVGRLSFAAWAVWGPHSRTRIRPLYTYCLAGAGPLPDLITKSFLWWLDRLERPPSVRMQLAHLLDVPLILYTDAEGSSGIGAVLISGTSSKWLGGYVPADTSRLLNSRKTQIVLYEALAVWAAFSALRDDIKDRTVLCFVDNSSALGALHKGSSPVSDLHAVVTVILDLAWLLSAKLTFRWVPSKLNLSDPPSRDSEPYYAGLRIPLRLRWIVVSRALEAARCKV